MKVNNHRDSVELSQMSRSKRSDRAAAAKARQDSGEAAGAGAAGSAAGVEISSEAKAMSAANQIARADEPDQEKINRIKALIHDGKYSPDFGKVADKMINETLLQEIS